MPPREYFFSTATGVQMTGRNLHRVVGVSFGLLCVLQAALNICLRLVIYSEAPDVTAGCNSTTEERNKLDAYFQKGWIHFQTSLYYISSTERTWKLSREDCLQKGADLVVINTRVEHDFVAKFKKAVWIGLMDEGSDERWRWVDGTPLTTSYWKLDEPNNFNGRQEDCVELISNVGWNDLDCETQNFFMCEKGIVLI